MADHDDPKALSELGARIDKASAARPRAAVPGGAGGGQDAGGALSLGLRVGMELVVAVIVGVGLGWLVDRYAGTRPWGLIAGFFLGVAVGMVSVYRTIAGLGMAVGYAKDGSAPPPVGNWDED